MACAIMRLLRTPCNNFKRWPGQIRGGAGGCRGKQLRGRLNFAFRAILCEGLPRVGLYFCCFAFSDELFWKIQLFWRPPIVSFVIWLIRNRSFAVLGLVGRHRLSVCVLKGSPGSLKKQSVSYICRPCWTTPICAIGLHGFTDIYQSALLLLLLIWSYFLRGCSAGPER